MIPVLQHKMWKILHDFTQAHFQKSVTCKLIPTTLEVWRTQKLSKWKCVYCFIPGTSQQITTINKQIHTDSSITLLLSLHETFLDPCKYASNQCKIPVQKTLGSDVSRNLELRKRKFVPTSACAQPSQYCVAPRCAVLCAHAECEAMESQQHKIGWTAVC